MRFACFGYINEKKWEQLSEEEQMNVLDDYLKYYQQLREQGNFLGGDGLKSGSKGCLISLDKGKVQETPLPADKEQIGGYFILEAKDIHEAISLVSKHPGLKVGAFEVRPIDEELTEMVGAK